MSEQETHQTDDHVLITDRLPVGEWQVDSGSSELNFRARTFFGLLPVNGFFAQFGGDLRVEEAGATEGGLRIISSSLATGIDRRDQQLRCAEFLDVAAHPRIEFRLHGLTGGGHQLRADGTLMIREISIPLSFPVTAIGHGDHLHLEARVRIDHQTAGLRWARPVLVGHSVRADVALTLRRAV
ncbi:MAG: YceI family protein [Solirubrobacteraceae bacterium]